MVPDRIGDREKDAYDSFGVTALVGCIVGGIAVVMVQGGAAFAAAEVCERMGVAVGEEEAGQVADGGGDGGEVVASGPEAFVRGGVAEDLT